MGRTAKSNTNNSNSKRTSSLTSASMTSPTSKKSVVTGVSTPEGLARQPHRGSSSAAPPPKVPNDSNKNKKRKGKEQAAELKKKPDEGAPKKKRKVGSVNGNDRDGGNEKSKDAESNNNGDHQNRVDQNEDISDRTIHDQQNEHLKDDDQGDEVQEQLIDRDNDVDRDKSGPEGPSSDLFSSKVRNPQRNGSATHTVAANVGETKIGESKCKNSKADEDEDTEDLCLAESLLAVPLEVITRAAPPQDGVPSTTTTTTGRPRMLLSRQEAQCFLQVTLLSHELDAITNVVYRALRQDRICKDVQEKILAIHHHAPLLRPVLPMMLFVKHDVSRVAVSLQMTHAARVHEDLARCSENLRLYSDQNWDLAQNLSEAARPSSASSYGTSLATEKRRLSELQDEVALRIDSLVQSGCDTSHNATRRAQIKAESEDDAGSSVAFLPLDAKKPQAQTMDNVFGRNGDIANDDNNMDCENEEAGDDDRSDDPMNFVVDDIPTMREFCFKLFDMGPLAASHQVDAMDVESAVIDGQEILDDVRTFILEKVKAKYDENMAPLSLSARNNNGGNNDDAHKNEEDKIEDEVDNEVEDDDGNDEGFDTDKSDRSMPAPPPKPRAPAMTTFSAPSSKDNNRRLPVPAFLFGGSSNRSTAANSQPPETQAVPLPETQFRSSRPEEGTQQHQSSLPQDSQASTVRRLNTARALITLTTTTSGIRNEDPNPRGDEDDSQATTILLLDEDDSQTPMTRRTNVAEALSALAGKR